MLELFLLAGIFEFFSDMMLVLRIFVFISIASFVLTHLGKGPIAIVLIVGLFVIMTSPAFFWFFGSVYVLMTLLMMGASGILIDFFFITNTGQMPAVQDGPVNSGADIAKRMQHGGAAAMMQRFRR